MSSLSDSYDELLDDIYPMVTFGDCTYLPSEVLKAVDPIAYDMGLADYEDNEEEEEEEDNESDDSPSGDYVPDNYTRNSDWNEEEA